MTGPIRSDFGNAVRVKDVKERQIARIARLEALVEAAQQPGLTAYDKDRVLSLAWVDRDLDGD